MSEHCPVCDSGSNTVCFTDDEVCSDICRLRGNQKVHDALEKGVSDISSSLTKEEFMEAMEGLADDLGLKDSKVQRYVANCARLRAERDKRTKKLFGEDRLAENEFQVGSVLYVMRVEGDKLAFRRKELGSWMHADESRLREYTEDGRLNGRREPGAWCRALNYFLKAKDLAKWQADQAESNQS